ncbi:hypothetical protein DPMN_179193 [Dreissena polymorpha]|uniref:Uncharacterized protein n=1 Tax=Dreissena polymorpha TaxID=45954 RepID=A0A9D4EE42_DREPO|nr:hypothetical protein DPMN_179193 [Dreissena polymorpha]
MFTQTFSLSSKYWPSGHVQPPTTLDSEQYSEKEMSRQWVPHSFASSRKLWPNFVHVLVLAGKCESSL